MSTSRGLGGLLSRVSKLVATRQASAADTYWRLVEQLADDDAKHPKAEAVVDICERAGRSLAELEQHVEAARLRIETEAVAATEAKAQARVRAAHAKVQAAAERRREAIRKHDAEVADREAELRDAQQDHREATAAARRLRDIEQQARVHRLGEAEAARYRALRTDAKRATSDLGRLERQLHENGERLAVTEGALHTLPEPRPEDIAGDPRRRRLEGDVADLRSSRRQLELKIAAARKAKGAAERELRQLDELAGIAPDAAKTTEPIPVEALTCSGGCYALAATSSSRRPTDTSTCRRWRAATAARLPARCSRACRLPSATSSAVGAL